ncbi:unnamed protein product, partial [Ixodes pacificus]
MHTRERPFNCHVRRRAFSQDATFQVHMRTHTGEKLFRCNNPGHKVFAQSFHSLSNRRAHTGERPYQCSMCGKAFEHLQPAIHASLREKHIKVAILKLLRGARRRLFFMCCNQYVGCFEIESVFASFFYALQSICRVFRDRIGISQTFERRFEKSYAPEHPRLSWQANSRSGKHRCRYCPYSSSSRAHVVNHERTHTGEKPYCCRFCSKAFTQQAGLVCHERAHTGEKPFSCRFCHKRFGERGSTLRHERIHTGQRPFRCEACGRGYADRSNLRYHQERCSLLGLLLVLLILFFFFFWQTRSPRPTKHWCRYCPYFSTSSSGLVIHERTHTGEKPFRCRFCTRAFIRQAYLVSHERAHTGEKPFNCRFCHKRFGDQANRIRHERLHTGERPFKCETCGKRY